MLTFDTVYAPPTASGAALSPAAQVPAGDIVTLRGLMAPPLKPELSMFVLLQACPGVGDDSGRFAAQRCIAYAGQLRLDERHGRRYKGGLLG